MQMRAAVLEEFGKPLNVTQVDLAEPRAGEVLVRLEACGVCHTDLYTASGADPSGYAPAVLGHEGAGVVEAVGEGVSDVAPGDHVVTLFSPQCRECVHCLSPRTNLCMAIREQQNRGYLPDGTARLSRDGEPIRHFMGTSTFAEYTVMPQIALAKISPEAPLDRACLFACGLSTGLGAAMFTAQVQAGLDLRGLRRRHGRARRGRRLPAAGGRAHRLRRPLRGAAGARPGPGRDRHVDRRRGHRRARPAGDGRLRRRLHLRGHGPGVGHGPGRRGRAHGLGPVHDRRRGGQGRDARRRSRACSSPAGASRARRSAGSRVATRSPSSSTATWRATSTSTPSSRTASRWTRSTAASS